jgi:hypothetical protein
MLNPDKRPKHELMDELKTLLQPEITRVKYTGLIFDQMRQQNCFPRIKKAEVNGKTFILEFESVIDQSFSVQKVIPLLSDKVEISFKSNTLAPRVEKPR